jgi:tRNA nucleotidyltransferase (CCA-adding enzyme)
VVAALPFDLDLRLAGWLRGARAASIVQRLRFSRRAVDRVARLLSLHPVEAVGDPTRDADVRRLLKRAGEDEGATLIALRRAELCCGKRAGSERANAALTRLDALEAGIERVRRAGALALRRFDLAIAGKQVMEILACDAGPQVGQALQHLTDRVVEDPSLNTPEALRALLEEWARRQP